MKKLNLITIIIMFITTTLSANNDRALKLYKQNHGGETKVALIVGNSNYNNRNLSKLKNPVNDARAVRDKLKEKDFEVLYIEDATQRELDKIIRRFTNKLKHSKVGLFYFAGHGLEVDKQNYLIPIGAKVSDIDDVKYEALAVNKIVDKMKRSGTRLNLVILDACRNNPFKRGTGGLAAMSNAKGTLIAYATDSGSTASDNPNEKNGLFTKHFLKALDEPLNQREFFHKIRMSVYKASGDKQLPYLNDGTIGDFYFSVDGKVNYVLNNNTNKELLDRLAKLEKELERTKKSTFKAPKKTYIPGSISNVWIDKSTGLMWQDNKEAKTIYTNWEGTEIYCQNLSLAGYSDWHLPNIDELKDLYNKIFYLENVAGNDYWSSSTYVNYIANAWYVNFVSGRSSYYSNKNSIKYVRCVRNGQ